MNGPLTEGSVPGILRECYVGRKSGVLSFIRGEERRSLHFRKGHIVRGESSAREEHLGETLERHGSLSSEDLERATAVVTSEGRRLGAVLQDLGLIDKQRMEDALALQAREILKVVFAWDEGSYVFEEQPPESQDVQDAEITLKLSTGELILEAVRHVQDPDVVRYALGDIDRILGHSSDPLLRFQHISLSPTDGFILSRVDGTHSAREIIQMSPTDTEDTERSLFGLLCTGVVEYLALPPKPVPTQAPLPSVAVAAPSARPEAAPRPAAAAPTQAQKELDSRRQEIQAAAASLKTKSHFDVLGITPAANEAQVKEAYFRLAKRFHPDTHHDPSLADLHDSIEAIFIRLGEAYDILRDRGKRSAYESDLAARAPRPAMTHRAAGPEPGADQSAEARATEEAVRRAERFLAEEKYWDAIQLLESARPAASGKWKARARIGLGRAYLKNPHWLKRAEEQLQTLVREDGDNAEAYFLLGTLYRQGGLRSRATSMFRKALEIRPDHEPAAEELAALIPDEAPPAEGGGLLKKFFGRS